MTLLALLLCSQIKVERSFVIDREINNIGDYTSTIYNASGFSISSRNGDRVVLDLSGYSFTVKESVQPKVFQTDMVDSDHTELRKYQFVMRVEKKKIKVSVLIGVENVDEVALRRSVEETLKNIEFVFVSKFRS